MRITPGEQWSELPQPFLSREAESVGLGPAALAGAVRRREVIKIAPAVYAVRQPWLDASPDAVHRALTRVGHRSVQGSVVSHVSAAVAMGLPTPQGPIGKVSLTVRETTRTSYPDDWRRVRVAALPDEHVMTIDDLVITTPSRTVLDCFRQSRFRDALAIADAASARGVIDPRGLWELRAFQSRWPGVRQADEGIPLIDPRRESWLESASVAVAHRRGFTMPESQINIHAPDGRFIGRVDHLWREAGVIGEADGRGKYWGAFSPLDLGPEQMAELLIRERDRERDLESLGFAVARWGTPDLRDHGAGLVQALVEARRRAKPQQIRCLWRRNVEDPLEPWVWPPDPTASMASAA